MASDDSLASFPANAWTYLTRTRVTWREASEGSLFFVLSALTGAMIMAGRGLVRSRTRARARIDQLPIRRGIWSWR